MEPKSKHLLSLVCIYNPSVAAKRLDVVNSPFRSVNN